MSLTVGELKQYLAGYEDDCELFFGNDPSVLSFCQLKRRGEKLVGVEFNQLIYRDKTGEVVYFDPEKDGGPTLDIA